MPISKVHSSYVSNNKGSCNKLAEYLEKENSEISKMIDSAEFSSHIDLLKTMKQGFFSHNQTDCSFFEVVDAIDNNIKKLGKNDAKFFAPTINFSKNEQRHLIEKITKRKDVESVLDLTPKEFSLYNKAIIDYAREVMNNYAANFNRQDKGLKDGSDLVYFGRVEHFRKHKGFDSEVKNGEAKTGDFKSGLQSHVHIIVSRKDITQKMKLDPTVKDKKTQRKIGGNAYTVGFSRNAWINLNEQAFNRLFNYQRPALEMFEVQKTIKNGSPSAIDLILKNNPTYNTPDFQEDLRKKKKRKNRFRL